MFVPTFVDCHVMCDDLYQTRGWRDASLLTARGARESREPLHDTRAHQKVRCVAPVTGVQAIA